MNNWKVFNVTDLLNWQLFTQLKDWYGAALLVKWKKMKAKSEYLGNDLVKKCVYFKDM